MKERKSIQRKERAYKGKKEKGMVRKEGRNERRNNLEGKYKS